MCVLVDDPLALQRWRPDPAEYEFLAPLRWRPGKEFPVFVSPAVMSPPAASPDLREERLAVGLMVKQVLDRGRLNRQPQDFITVPLNEPIPTPEDSQDAIPVPKNTRPPFPYDYPRPITDDKPRAKPAAAHSLFSVTAQASNSVEGIASVAKDVNGRIGISAFDLSIAPVAQYQAEVDSNEPKLFLSSLSEDIECSPLLKQAPPSALASSPSLCTYMTWSCPPSPLPLTPRRRPSDKGPSRPVYLEKAVCGFAKLEDYGDQMVTSPTFLAPPDAAGPFIGDGKRALFDAPVWLLI